MKGRILFLSCKVTFLVRKRFEVPNIQSYSSVDSCYVCAAQILACKILLILFECYKYNYTLMQQIIPDYIWWSMKLMFLFLMEP